MKSGEQLYNSIICGELGFDTLNPEEISLLFDYLCVSLEQGHEIDSELMKKCEMSIASPVAVSADEIINRTYSRLGITQTTKKQICCKNIIRRCLVSVAAVLTFAVFTFITVSALGINVVEQVKTIFTDQGNNNKYNILFEDNDTYYQPEGRTVTYNSLEKLFNRELPGYLYPASLPEGIEPSKVSDMSEDSDNLFVLQLKSGSGQSWQMIAASEEKSYLPLGYSYTANINGEKLDFIYTVARNNGEISRYSVYTVYEGVQYTFYLYTDNWADVKIILDSLTKTD